MNKYNPKTKNKIIFSELKEISEAFDRGYNDVVLDYLNSFKGDDIYEKFKTILKLWEYDVSYTLNFNINDIVTKIQLSYINSQFRELTGDTIIKENGIEIVFGIPTQFEISDTIPIYNTIKSIKIYGIFIDFTNLSFYDKKIVIDNLPADIFNIIIKNIKKDQNKIVSMDNPLMKDFHLNFLTSDPLLFLKGLFKHFDEFYFKDVIFTLSKRLGGDVLFQSTPLEIEYYVEKMSNSDPSENIPFI